MARFTKGMIVPIDGAGLPVVFQWNPHELQINKDVKWKGVHTAGREQPVYQYGCGEARSVGLSIEVSRMNNSDFFVKGFYEQLQDLARPRVRGMGVNRPPRVQLILGASVNMTCTIDNINFKFGSRSQKGQAYLATADWLLPKEGYVIMKFVEYI
jgi:hypothetical protein